MTAAVSSQCSACVVDGIHTDIVITPFANRTFVVITQTGTMGNTMVEASCDSSVDGRAGSYTVRTCCGRFDDPVPEVYARQLAERLGQPILLSIAMKDSSPAAFRTIVEACAALQKRR